MVRIAHVVDGVVVNVSVAEKFADGDIDGTDAGIGDLYAKGKFTRPPVVIPVPTDLPWWKGRAIIELRGMTAAIEAFIGKIPDDGQRNIAQAAWDGADFSRSSPLVNAALSAIGLSEADKDRLFIDGNALTL